MNSVSLREGPRFEMTALNAKVGRSTGRSEGVMDATLIGLRRWAVATVAGIVGIGAIFGGYGLLSDAAARASPEPLRWRRRPRDGRCAPHLGSRRDRDDRLPGGGADRAPGGVDRRASAAPLEARVGRDSADVRPPGGGAMSAARVDLYWLPLGAGGHSVRLNGKVFEAVAARFQKRTRQDLYHSALAVKVPDGRFVIEQAPAADDGVDRGVVAEGPVGASWAGRLRLFRYEIRRWRDGV